MVGARPGTRVAARWVIRGVAIRRCTSCTGPTLAERAARSRPAGSPAKHCWVINPPEGSGSWPGLVLEWRKQDGTSSGWAGRAVYAVTPAGGDTVLIEAWLDAAQLQQR